MSQEDEQLIGTMAPPSGDMASPGIAQSSQPIIVQFQPTPLLHYEKFNSKLGRKLAITQLVVGGVTLLLNAIGIVLENHVWGSRPYNIASGVWGVVFIGLSGGFSLRAAKLKTKCSIVTTLVMSVLSLTVATVVVGMACWAMPADVEQIKYAYGSFEVYSGLVVSVLFLAAGLAQVVTCCRTIELCARVVRCAQSGSVSNCGDTLMQVVDSEGQPIPGARVIQVPGSSDTHQLLATPASVLEPNPYGSSRWSCIFSCVKNRGNESDHIKPPPYLQ